MPKSLDLKQTWKTLYAPSSTTVSEVNVPPFNFLMIDGQGNPNTDPAYASAVEALYALAYAIKFKVKKSPGGVDFAVMPLEGLWWTDDMREFSVERKSDWKWTMMILQPDIVSADLVGSAQAETIAKKRLPALERIRFETYHEGPSAQIMHLGPYTTEAPNIARIHDFIASHGYSLRGKHHEIYLSDPRKTAPEKLKTVIRQPRTI
jgi:hypothetical protein